MDRLNSMHEIERDRLLWQQKTKTAICKEFKISGLHAGGVLIRNEKSWRENKKEVDYFWNINISKSLVGSLNIFALKFDRSEFRDIKNPDEFIQGLLTLNNNGEIDKIYYELNPGDTIDELKEIGNFNLFDSNTGITIDGTSYDVTILAKGIESIIHLNNPQSKNWQLVIKKITELGKKLSANSKDKELIDFFSY